MKTTVKTERTEVDGEVRASTITWTFSLGEEDILDAIEEYARNHGELGNVTCRDRDLDRCEGSISAHVVFVLREESKR